MFQVDGNGRVLVPPRTSKEAVWPAGRKKDESAWREKSVSQPGHQGLVVTVKTSDFTVSEEAVHKERLSPKE